MDFAGRDPHKKKKEESPIYPAPAIRYNQFTIHLFAIVRNLEWPNDLT